MRKQPRTKAQRAASRTNGTKSQGPITPRGKSRSSQQYQARPVVYLSNFQKISPRKLVHGTFRMQSPLQSR